MEWSAPAPLRDALSTAMETGDVACVSSFFSLPTVRDQVARMEACFAVDGALWTSPVEPEDVFPAHRTLLDDVANPRDPWYMGPSSELVLLPAVTSGQCEVVEWFFSPSRVDTMGATLAFFLPVLVKTAVTVDHEGILELLLTSQVFSDYVLHGEKERILRQALCAALERDAVEMIGLLVAHGAEVNNVSASTHPGEHLADYAKVECVDALSQNGVFWVGATLDLGRFACDGRESTATALLAQGVDHDLGSYLHQAVEDADLEAVQRLLTFTCFDVDYVNEQLQSALMMVAWQESIELGHYRAHPVKIVKLLVDLGANINLKDQSGYTPLHYACRLDLPDVVEVLLKNGADPHARCWSGGYPHDEIAGYYIEYGLMDEMMDLLLERQVDLRAENQRTRSMFDRLSESVGGRAFIAARPRYFEHGVYIGQKPQSL